MCLEVTIYFPINYAILTFFFSFEFMESLVLKLICDMKVVLAASLVKRSFLLLVQATYFYRCVAGI